MSCLRQVLVRLARMAAVFFTTRIADERAVLAVEHDAFHLPLANIAVDRHGAIRREDVQLAPLAQSTTDRFNHGMPWQ